MTSPPPPSFFFLPLSSQHACDLRPRLTVYHKHDKEEHAFVLLVGTSKDQRRTSGSSGKSVAPRGAGY